MGWRCRAVSQNSRVGRAKDQVFGEAGRYGERVSSIWCRVWFCVVLGREGEGACLPSRQQTVEVWL